MNIALIGMRSQEAAALEVLASKKLVGWTSHSVASLQDLDRQVTNICVVDLPEIGMHRFSEHSAAKLLEVTAGLPTILLTRQHDIDWFAWNAECHDASHCICVRKPVTAQVMQEVLERQINMTTRGQSIKLTRSNVDHASPLADVTSPKASVVFQTDVGIAAVAPTQFDDESLDAEELSPEAFMSHVQQMDAAKPSLFLQKLADALAGNELFEVQLTLQHGLLVCPQENWIASNTPFEVVKRLISSDALAAAANVRSLHGDAERYLNRHPPMSIQSLEVFLWKLVQIG
jgi:hypothetical protein